MDERGQSYSRVVPAKPSNNAAGGETAQNRAVAEGVEERRLAEGNTASKTRPGRRAGPDATSALERVRGIAAADKEVRFTALLHHLSVDRLRTAYLALRREAASGVDGVDWQSYGQDLEQKLQDLHGRVQRGAYRAKPSRRVYIPKPNGRRRPLGIAALEDKIVQGAVVEVMNAIYETDFLGFSYGFRPGRNQHQALDALATGIVEKKVNWVLDADLRDCFGSLDQGWLMRFLEHRIGDRRLLRLIQKWMRAGVIEEGEWTACEEGTPQGATISPLLANVYLHYVFDQWAHQWRRRHAQGEVIIVRYADDFIVGFEHRDEAEQFLSDLSERLAKFELELQAEKTRLIEFGRDAARRRKAQGLGRPETFDFLGFVHACGKTRSGAFMLKRITISKRMQGKLSEVKTELRERRHLPIPRAGKMAGQRAPGLLRLLRGAGQLPRRGGLPPPGGVALVPVAAPPQPANALDLGANESSASPMAAPPPHHASLPQRPLSTPAPEAGTQCSSSARWGLCGGPPVRAVPTATSSRGEIATVRQRSARLCALGPFARSGDAPAGV